MSSHKRRHKDRHSVSPDETNNKVSKKKNHHKDDLDYHNLKRNRSDDADDRDYSVERDSRKEKGDYSDENNKHEKTKKSKLHKNYEEQYHRSKNTHSEPSLNDKKRKKDYSKSNSNHKLDDRNSRAKEYASDDDEYHVSRSNVKDRNFDFNSYNRKTKTYGKYYSDYESFDRNSRRNEFASDDDYDSSRNRDRERSWKDDRNREKENTQSSYSSTRRDNFRGRTATNEVKERSRNAGNNSLESNADSQQKDNSREADVSEVNKPPTKKKMGVSGAYIPPAKLRLMQQEIADKGSIEYQKIAWEALKKSINGLTNKINTSNIAEIVKELFKENIIRGRGVLCRAVMQAQALSPTFTHVYAALVAVINTKFPEISELLLKRLTLQFKRGFRRNDKMACLSSVRFMAHLLNQQVAHEILILEILTLLLENPTDHSVEVAIALLKDCGQRLNDISRKGANAIKDRLRHVLHECSLDVRTQYMLEVMFAVMKDKYKDYPSVIPELDLVEEGDKFTHFIALDEAVDAEDILNVFQFDSNYEENEERYKSLVKEILGESDSEESGDSEAGESDSEEENDNESGENQEIVDMTETNLVVLRRNIYLTIQSSLDFEECAHKLLKMELKPGEVMEMCYMILDCCAQQRTYEKFYGLLAQRFCQLNKMYSEPFMEIFRNSYDTIHRLETNKLRNVAKFFAHLLYTDAIHWNVLSNIRLNENDTTSSSRIFIKILFQELCEYMGLPLLNARVKDVTLQEAFDGLFPRDNPHNTRFAINFFTSIGLGGLTDELREHLKNVPKTPLVSASEKPLEIVSEDSTSSSSTSSSSSSSSSSTSSSSDSDSDEPRKKSKKRKKINLKNEKPSKKRSTKKKKRS